MTNEPLLDFISGFVAGLMVGVTVTAFAWATTDHKRRWWHR